MTRHNEELPPTYEESEAPALPARPPSPPSSAHRAVAPLTLADTNASIKGTYAVRLMSNKAGPDVKISSTNGAVAVTLFLQGTLFRPAVVDVITTNGRVDLTVHRDSAAIDVTAKSSNGSVTLNLPEDFDGLVTVRVINGRKRVEGMAGVIWPSEGDEKSITYRVRPASGGGPRRPSGPSGPRGCSGPSGKSLDKQEQEYKRHEEEYARFQEVSPTETDLSDKGPDRAYASTHNGSVKVQYIGMHEEGGSGDRSSCSIM
ncbi:hypothetical protein CC85DRAFT_330600 [Cutaneotrichosporon oleaginosum]|uniref:DUF7330 domain-containing protein n=1 Tax=Cutaneotrichosporon oleaginosum TaxID=879819 RepID=A0A0J1AWC2_9TREE|nr:uncharacterized protein CC85DRAFT_330600 [Cutaneotrichosporon oleaginosum]KLT39584.1 hypothetical protein CC85DRAFT_330600 [Cutaneotrichosporon oleaginosum]TXT15488.1 hypothetical protein COLE_01681 [Cutaneotrichosporon oleaginosum]